MDKPNKPLRAYICTHRGVYLGGYSLVFARDKTSARRSVRRLLKRHKLSTEGIELREVRMRPGSILIWNGDY